MDKFIGWLRCFVIMSAVAIINNMGNLNASDKADLVDHNQKVAVFVNKLSQFEKLEITEKNIEHVLNKATLQLDSLNLDYNISAIHKITDKILRDKIAFPATCQQRFKSDTDL